MNTETLNFETPNGATTAVVALPTEANGNANAVVLIHEWWGINDHIRDLAGRYAREGYLCIAPDLYRGRTTTDQQEASKLMHDLALDDGIDIINRAIEAGRAKYGVERFAITGYCMGGIFALRAACLNDALSAAAPFYGDIPEDEILARLKTPTIFFAGARDNWITPEKVEQLTEAARRHGLPLEVVSYDADHAFFNDTRPEVYNPEAAADAWQRVLKFFGETFDRRQER
ncbi:MAG TPA: alpha/beta fold hydrolase [Pyrinomonadaceae bacterium]|jgi:carboxymethylenebutenolidase